MGTFVLILIMNIGHGLTTVRQEFSNSTLCERALDDISKSVSDHHITVAAAGCYKTKPNN